METKNAQSMRRRLQGTVVSTGKMAKTITVKIDRTVVHPKYGKRFEVSKKFLVHDEAGTAKMGEVVTIEETRPLSARKRWRVVSAA